MRAAVVTLACIFAAARAAAVDFLVPGVSLSSVSLVPGSRVSYLVVTETFGSSDSSWVEIAVLSHGSGEVRIDVATAPYPQRRAETFTVRLRVADRVVSISSADEFRGCLREILIREGEARFRAPTADELEELAIEDLFLPPSGGAERRDLPPETVTVPAGAFLCTGVETERYDARAVTLGGVGAERIEEEMTRIRLSKDVPLWGLVKSRMERRTTIRRSGSPGGTPRVTITESTLLSFKKPGAD